MNKSITFEFNRAKAIESILYLSEKIANSDIYGICKLLYLVDKTSLEKYGRFIFGETYCAMAEGPAPSNAYDLLKEASRTPVDGIKIEGYQVIPLRKPDIDYLSQSDIECLDQIVAIYGDKPNWYRAQDTHDSAYYKSWDKRGNKDSIVMPVEDIAQLLSNSEDLIDYISNVG